MERLIRIAGDRVYYLVNNTAPRWYTRKCWECGNKHSEATAQACTYCSSPLSLRRFIMCARWDAASSLSYQAFVHRRLRHKTLGVPLALYRYEDQLLSFFHWDQDQLLSGEPSPLSGPAVLSVAFQLADALDFLHRYGVVLQRITPSNVLVGKDGRVRLFDLEVDKLVDRPLPANEDPTLPPLRDLRELAGMLAPFVAAEDQGLREFLKSVRRGAFRTADALASGVSSFAHSRRDFEANTRAGAFTDCGVVRDRNEDHWSWQMLPNGQRWFCVADGMGGHHDGATASALATRTVSRAAARRAKKPKMSPKDLEGVVRDAMNAANVAVVNLGKEQGRQMGTTLAVALVQGSLAVIGNAGDSRAYLFRGGTMRQLTEDHSMTAAMVAEGRLAPEDAPTHPKAGVLLQFLGGTPDIDPDVYQVDLGREDRLLLCSDGLWGEVTDLQMASVLSAISDPRRAVRKLLRMANDAGGRDNVTAMVIDPSV